MSTFEEKQAQDAQREQQRRDRANQSPFLPTDSPDRGKKVTLADIFKKEPATEQSDYSWNGQGMPIHPSSKEAKAAREEFWKKH